MSRHLSELLSAQEPLFSISLRQLERTTANPSIDVRLSADIMSKVHHAHRALGLDPHDTTGEELYGALTSLVGLHDRILAGRLGGDDPTDAADMLPRIKRFIDELDIPRQTWALKSSTAKRLLKASPPKKLMKQLNYRSLDSMLKREPVNELYAGLRFCESPEWLNGFLAKYKSLTPADFEHRDVDITLLDAKKWGTSADQYVRARRHNILFVKETGVIAILPLPVSRLRGIAISVLPMLLHYIFEIRMHSAYFKLNQVRPDFGDRVSRAVLDNPHHAVMAGQPVHWRVLHRYYGGQDPNFHPEVFQPHVQADDLVWRKVEEVLYRIEPALHFWHDMEYVGVVRDGRVVSFNLIDMAINYVNNIPYGHQSYVHFRESLWNELYERYLGQPALEALVRKQLGNEASDPMLTSFTP